MTEDIVNLGMIECPYCMCIFTSQENLDSHLDPFGTYKSEHLRLLDKDHKSVDSTYSRGMLSKGSKKVYKSRGYRFR